MKGCPASSLCTTMHASPPTGTPMLGCPTLSARWRPGRVREARRRQTGRPPLAAWPHASLAPCKPGSMQCELTAAQPQSQAAQVCPPKHVDSEHGLTAAGRAGHSTQGSRAVRVLYTNDTVPARPTQPQALSLRPCVGNRQVQGQHKTLKWWCGAGGGGVGAGPWNAIR